MVSPYNYVIFISNFAMYPFWIYYMAFKLFFPDTLTPRLIFIYIINFWVILLFETNSAPILFQSTVAVVLLEGFKFLNLIKYRDLDWNEARNWFPIAAFLVAMIYTGSKSLQYLRIPIYTIFKNLTIILIAYGEVLWFGSHVTQLMLVSFILMVSSIWHGGGSNHPFLNTHTLHRSFLPLLPVGLISLLLCLNLCN
jgi:hypothetical protein